MTQKIEFAYGYIRRLRQALDCLANARNPDWPTGPCDTLVNRLRVIVAPRLPHLDELQESDLWHHVYAAIRSELSEEESHALDLRLAADDQQQHARQAEGDEAAEQFAQSLESPIE